MLTCTTIANSHMEEFAIRIRPLALKQRGLDHYADMLLAEAGLTRAGIKWWRRSGNGRVTKWAKIAAPTPTSHDRLLVLAHEIGHYLLHTADDGTGRRVQAVADARMHVIEYEAVQFSFEWFQKDGLLITPGQDAWVRQYVFGFLIDEVYSGIAPSTEVLCWIGYRREELFSEYKRLLPESSLPGVLYDVPLPSTSIPHWKEVARKCDEELVARLERCARVRRAVQIATLVLTSLAAWMAAWL